ncbi:MAG: ATP-binding protein [Firmicutes bacterium]|nr:ATP-binding protein [Bacillota bacterium]
MEIKKIVITGGPCGGKSTAMRWISHVFTEVGYKVLFVSETATELITGGVAPWTCGSNLEYQKCQVSLQMFKEKIYEQAARTMPQEKILIVCDRAALDNKAYMTDEEYRIVLDGLGLEEKSVILSYDAVFHLVTAAKDTVRFYTFENNQARYENVEEAVALDERIWQCWSPHPHHRRIPGQEDFAEKMRLLVGEIAAFLGVSVEMAEKAIVDITEE